MMDRRHRSVAATLLVLLMAAGGVAWMADAEHREARRIAHEARGLVPSVFLNPELHPRLVLAEELTPRQWECQVEELIRPESTWERAQRRVLDSVPDSWGARFGPGVRQAARWRREGATSLLMTHGRRQSVLAQLLTVWPRVRRTEAYPVWLQVLTRSLQPNEALATEALQVLVEASSDGNPEIRRIAVQGWLAWDGTTNREAIRLAAQHLDRLREDQVSSVREAVPRR
jgi:hypothetical protein